MTAAQLAGTMALGKRWKYGEGSPGHFRSELEGIVASVEHVS